MSTIDWPAGVPAQFQLSIARSALQFTSPFNGSMQASILDADLWRCTVTMPPLKRELSGAVEALANWLAGGVNKVRVWHFGSGGRPGGAGMIRGQARGSWVLANAAARGDRHLDITGAQLGDCALAGDMLGAGGFLFQVGPYDCAASDGAMTVNLVNCVRAQIAQGTTVQVWRPTADFYMPSTSAPGTHVARAYLPPVFDLIEAG